MSIRLAIFFAVCRGYHIFILFSQPCRSGALFCKHLRQLQWKVRILMHKLVDTRAQNPSLRQQFIRYSRQQAAQIPMLDWLPLHRPCISSLRMPLWQRACLWLCILFIVVSLLLALSTNSIVHARNSVSRRDRRPDREVRIRYPPSRSRQVQSNQSTLQSTPDTSQSIQPASEHATNNTMPSISSTDE